MLLAQLSAKDSDEQILLLGLTRGNLNRLAAGQPMLLSPETHPGIPQGWKVMILFGETEEALAAELMTSSSFTADTKVERIPRSPDLDP